jgi:hypothetical protein
MAKSSGSGSGAIIGLFAFALFVIAVGVFLYSNPRILQGEGDTCKPNEDELVDNADKKTYELDEEKECIPTECVEGYSLSSGSCVKSSSTSTPTSGEAAPSSTPTSGGSAPSSAPTPGGAVPSSTPSVEIVFGDNCPNPPVDVVIPNASAYRKDTRTNKCRASECNRGYTFNSDKTKCISDGVRTTRVWNCEDEFSADQTGSCWLNNEAGVAWNWGNDANEFCNKQLKYYEVTVKSQKDPSHTFKTKLPPGTSGAGVRDLPYSFMDANLSFTVNPILKDGEPVLTNPKEIALPLNKNKGACSAAGIPVTDAFTNWNENDNMYRMHWVMGGGNVGSTFAAKNGTVYYDTGAKADGESGVITVAQGTVPGTWCHLGGAGLIWPHFVEIYPNKHYKIGHSCWSGNNHQWWLPVDAPGPVKSTL